jgi:hypothetical protein
MYSHKMASLIKVYVSGRHSSLYAPAIVSTEPKEHVVALFIADILKPALLCQPLQENCKYSVGFYNNRIQLAYSTPCEVTAKMIIRMKCTLLKP